MLALARPMRCAIVASGTSNARAISAVLSPPTARRVSASCEGTDSAGWQQRNRSGSVSSPPVGAGGGGSSARTASSRRWRACSLRNSSTSRREATVTNQARGSSGRPSRFHCCAAASSASCTASSHASNCLWRRTRAPRAWGANSRSRPSSDALTARAAHRRSVAPRSPRSNPGPWSDRAGAGSRLAPSRARSPAPRSRRRRPSSRPATPSPRRTVRR